MTAMNKPDEYDDDVDEMKIVMKSGVKVYG